MSRSSARPHPLAWRILVAGGGPPGLALGLGLARSLGDAVSVTICDPAVTRTASDGRAYALSPGAVLMFEALGVWPALAARTQPILRMTITDSRLDDAIRAGLPDLSGRGSPPRPHDRGEAPRGGTARRLPGRGRRAPGGGRVGRHAIGRLDLGAVHGRARPRRDAPRGGGRLALAACGTWPRSAGSGMLIPRRRSSRTVSHERPHGGAAIQHFLPSGPFAILPLPGRSGPLPSPLVRSSGRTAWPASRRSSGAPPRRLWPRSRSGSAAGSGRSRSRRTRAPIRSRSGLARGLVAGRLVLLGDAGPRDPPPRRAGAEPGPRRRCRPVRAYCEVRSARARPRLRRAPARLRAGPAPARDRDGGRDRRAQPPVLERRAAAPIRAGISASASSTAPLLRRGPSPRRRPVRPGPRRD